MNRKALVIIIISVIALTVISGVVFVKTTPAGGKPLTDPDTIQAAAEASGLIDFHNSDNDSDYTYIPPTPVDSSTNDNISSYELNEVEQPFVPATEMDLDPSSTTVFVNQEYALPKDYKPVDLVTPNVIFNLITYDERTMMRSDAAQALEKLFEAAEMDNIILYGISGYRSYERQYKIFTNNIVKKGKKHTLKYSAVPGTSEHQTGLAIDVSAKSINFKLSLAFASSPEGIWLAKNAYLYGYIIRYPKGDEKITGYAFEPWHIRYVGKDLANYLYTNQLTLEEYYNYTPSPTFNFEAFYADLINYIPPAVTVQPMEGEGVIIGENGEIIDGEIIDGEINGELPAEIPAGEEEMPGEEGNPNGEVPSEADDDDDDEAEDITGTPTDGSSNEDDVDEQEPPIENGSDTTTEDDSEDPDSEVPAAEQPNDDTGVTTPTPTMTPTPALGTTSSSIVDMIPSDNVIVNN